MTTPRRGVDVVVMRGDLTGAEGERLRPFLPVSNRAKIAEGASLRMRRVNTELRRVLSGAITDFGLSG
ncbi:hypothetical protein AB0D04_41120 [Streptomyces sp. NPDC048483]|uniref:hypothetical protein n=1 Tax=Streptomyces sp. NPDC048483 TaxID=3154927 RepID=UPI00344565CC